MTKQTTIVVIGSLRVKDCGSEFFTYRADPFFGKEAKIVLTVTSPESVSILLENFPLLFSDMIELLV